MDSHAPITFSKHHSKLIVGVLDIVKSTELTSTLSADEVDSFYTIFLEPELVVLEKMGLQFTVTPKGISENGITKLADIAIRPSTLVAFPEKIHARPYPGLNIDNLPFFAVIGTQAEGTTLIHDWVYEKRAVYYTELDRFGAVTQLLDPHRINIEGPSHLRAADIYCPPALRPATILLIGALAATGRSTLKNVYSINRGYEDLVARLRSIGADIQSAGS
jgi:UDP-N-acetylglucosamine 1-carboxyvinyltransferase